MIEVLVTLWISGFFLGFFTKDILSLFDEEPPVVWKVVPMKRPPSEVFKHATILQEEQAEKELQ